MILNGPLEARDQAFLADGLGEEAERTALERGSAHMLVLVR